MVFSTLLFWLRMRKKRELEQNGAAPKESNGPMLGKKTRPTFTSISELIVETQSEFEDSKDLLLPHEPCSFCSLEAWRLTSKDRVCRCLDAVKLNLKDVKEVITLASTPSTDSVEQFTRSFKEGLPEPLNISTKKGFCSPSILRSAQGYLRTKLGLVKGEMQTQDARPIVPEKSNTDSIFVPRSTMPPKPLHFRGRPHIVSEITQQLCSGDTTLSRVAILASIGMGKTAVAVQVMESEAVANAFKHQHRIWVSCGGATSVDDFLGALMVSLGLKSVWYPSLAKILDNLDMSDDPRLLVLDHFEVPWHFNDGHRIQRVLCSLVERAHVAILITMRSKVPPAWTTWQVHHLPSIDPEACRKIFTDIHPAAAQDESDLNEFLTAVGHTPYAIVLMATHARRYGYPPPGGLLRFWNEVGPSILSEDGIYCSISVSLGYRLMKEQLVAHSLLITLSLLPAGTPQDHLSWWVPTLEAKQVVHAARVLTLRATCGPTDTSPLTSPISLYPLIRSYVEYSYCISARERTAHRETAFKIVCDRPLSTTDPNFQQNLQDIRSEATNLHHILTAAANARLEKDHPPKEACDNAYDKSLLDSLLVFSRYQLHAGTRPDVARLATKLARYLKSDFHLEELDCLAAQTSME